MMVADPKFPLGPFDESATLCAETRRMAIDDIAALPRQMYDAVAGLSDAQLDTPYRDGGWTVRQLIHHVADSHANAFIRMKVALTDSNPLVMKFNQNAFASLADARLPIAPSLSILQAVHARWTVVCRSLIDPDWTRPFLHPELGPLTIERHIHLYAWHGRHHVAHVTNLRSTKAW
jgi:DinB superfamily